LVDFTKFLQMTTGFVNNLMSTGWNNPTIHVMPSLYVLDKSHRFLDCNVHDPAVIMENLADCFRILSLWLIFDQNSAGAVLLSPEQIEMHVCLWSVEGGQKICVEVHRRSGDSLTFHTYAKHILEASSGDFDSVEYLRNDSYLDYHYLKQAEMVAMIEWAIKSDRTKASFETISYVLNLINDERLDNRILGMESLCILSDVTKTSISMAHTISRCVLFREGEDKYGKIHDFIFYVIQKQCMPPDDMILTESLLDDDSDDEEYFDDEDCSIDRRSSEYEEAMRCLMTYGLTIVANCLEAIYITKSYQVEAGRSVGCVPSTSCDIVKLLYASSNTTNVDILKTLVEILGNGNAQPHNASEAARCLKLISRLLPEARELVLRSDASQIAHHAQRIGLAKHSRLQRESRELLQVLSH
jgi:hypothetical protein